VELGGLSYYMNGRIIFHHPHP